ncbi:hypothetical protein SBX64_07775 [Vibrio rhizosphaerae]|uniref:Uncharacterized protein n=1 Tax=Vibrio rhizosphaerae TaxID=398736 RepID=A0ABU4ITK6_9VIBR|nr:hypothetical protein [Vibrio rhizosphaerae]MDW6092442.1 hypothetical protein [Vibrio rhizosphaerae]
MNGHADTFWVSGLWKPCQGDALDEFKKSLLQGKYPVVHIGKPDSVLYGEVMEEPMTRIEIKLTS